VTQPPPAAGDDDAAVWETGVRDVPETAAAAVAAGYDSVKDDRVAFQLRSSTDEGVSLQTGAHHISLSPNWPTCNLKLIGYFNLFPTTDRRKHAVMPNIIVYYGRTADKKNKIYVQLQKTQKAFKNY